MAGWAILPRETKTDEDAFPAQDVSAIGSRGAARSGGQEERVATAHLILSVHRPLLPSQWA